MLVILGVKIVFHAIFSPSQIQTTHCNRIRILFFSCNNSDFILNIFAPIFT